MKLPVVPASSLWAAASYFPSGTGLWPVIGVARLSQRVQDSIGSSLFKDEGIMFRLVQRFNFNIRIQIGPVKLGGRETLHLENLADGGVVKNRIVSKGNEIFPIVHQNPKTQGFNVGDFTGRNAGPRQT
jgi:hypothetical protein